MVNSERRQIPTGVVLISAFYLFGAVVLLMGMFTNPAAVSRSIAAAHGLSSITDTFILPLVAALSIFMAYGLLRLSRWGFYFSVIYLSIFGLISIWLMIDSWQQPYIGNSTWSLLVLVYLGAKRQVFLRSA